ncbi:MAG TPA: hypothetical protein VIH04_09720 [Nitrosarchaeum sp.]
MALTSNQLIQINATVIAGLLVLLGIMTQQSQAIFGMKDVDSTILEFSLLIQIIIQTLIIPFALSATIEVVHSIKNKERENNATKSGLIVSAIGFISLVIFFALEVMGGLVILYGN